MFPRRRVDLSHWLADWIRKGAVPIATLNLQKGVKTGQTVPDAWHHQVCFTVRICYIEIRAKECFAAIVI